MSNPLTEPRLHNSVAPSAAMYHSAAAGASSTASMSEIDNVMHDIVNAARRRRHSPASLNDTLHATEPIKLRNHSIGELGRSRPL